MFFLISFWVLGWFLGHSIIRSLPYVEQVKFYMNYILLFSLLLGKGIILGYNYEKKKTQENS